MANIKAQATGNWSATATWAGGVVPVAGDDVWANGATVTLNQDIVVNSLNNTAVTGISFNGGSTSANAGGSFSAGSLVANISFVDLNAGSATCLNVTSANANLVVTSTGIISGSSTTSGAHGITWSGVGAGTINANTIRSGNVTTLSGNGITIGGGSLSVVSVTGNLIGRSAQGLASNVGGGQVNFTGTISNQGAIPLSANSSTGTINCDAITTAGSTTSMISIAGNGILNFVGTVSANTSVQNISAVVNNNSNIVNWTGNTTGGASSSHGIQNLFTGVLNINGTAIGGNNGGSGAHNNSVGTINLKRARANGWGVGSVGIVPGYGLTASNQASVNIVQELEFGERGLTPITAIAIRIADVTTNVAIFRKTDGTQKTLVDAAATADFPAASNVRLGTAYNVGSIIGTLAVPIPASVSLGVATDNTTGTAVLTAANVQTALTAQGLTTGRADKLDNLDATVSTRLAASAYTAPDNASITAIKAKTDNLPESPAAVSDIPTAAANAAAVRTNLTTELARIDVATSTRLATSGYTAPDNASITAIKAKTDNLPESPASASDVPTAAANAAAVRTNLTTELARIDSTISSRSTLTASQVQAAVIPIL